MSVQSIKKRVSAGLKKGDQVMVISGGNKNKRPNKGKVGKILRFVGDDRVVVEGLNLFTRHVKPRQAGQSGSKIQKEASIHISNVMLYIETLKRPVKICYQIGSDGVKSRGYKNPSTKEFVRL